MNPFLFLLLKSSSLGYSLCNFILMLLINCICSQMMHHVSLLIFSSLLLLPFKGVAGIKFKRSFYLKNKQTKNPQFFSVITLHLNIYLIYNMICILLCLKNRVIIKTSRFDLIYLQSIGKLVHERWQTGKREDGNEGKWQLGEKKKKMMCYTK